MVHRAPTWALASAVIAPIALIGGWTLAASRQPPGYNPIRDTISSLAARGAADRWVMTAALAVVGASYLITAAGLSAVRPAGRTVLAAGGVATLAVAAFPQPVRGNGVAHTIAASAAFALLALWPLLAMRQRAPAILLSPTASLTATLTIIGLVLWFALELHGGHRGLAERTAAAAEALWPLAVVLSLRTRHDEAKQLIARVPRPHSP